MQPRPFDAQCLGRKSQRLLESHLMETKPNHTKNNNLHFCRRERYNRRSGFRYFFENRNSDAPVQWDRDFRFRRVELTAGKAPASRPVMFSFRGPNPDGPWPCRSSSGGPVHPACAENRYHFGQTGPHGIGNRSIGMKSGRVLNLIPGRSTTRRLWQIRESNATPACNVIRCVDRIVRYRACCEGRVAV